MSSEGCTLKKPRLIQRMAPRDAWPRPNTAARVSARAAQTTSAGRPRIQSHAGRQNTMRATRAKPPTAKMSWRSA